MKRGRTYDWIPLWRQKWLWGSTRLELGPAERSVWIDLLCIAGNDDGHIRANEKTSYGREQLAGMLCIPVDLLNETIEKCLKHGKLKDGENGTLYVNSWNDYQLGERYRRMVNPPQKKSSAPAWVPCPMKFSSMATKKGLVRSHRLLAAIALGRPLKDCEEVHHINGDDGDDQIDNLMLFSTHRDHLRFQHGHDIRPIWDGSQIAENEIAAISAEYSALGAEKAAPIHKTYTETNTDTEKNNGRKAGPLTETEIEEKFKEFWSVYPREGRLAKKESRLKFGALVKRGELAEFIKGFHGYTDYLKHQKVKNRFEQRPMYAKTFLNGRWLEFVDFKYESPL